MCRVHLATRSSKKAVEVINQLEREKGWEQSKQVVPRLLT